MLIISHWRYRGI